MRNALIYLGCFTLLSVTGCSIFAGLDQPAELSRSAGWGGRAVNSVDAFRFVVVSDRTGGHQPGAWAEAVEQINRLKPDFVVSIGDLIEGYTANEETVRQEWEEFDAVTRQLDAPFFYCAGNHDVGDAVPRKFFTELHGVDGKAYYSFDYRGCHFVVLDSEALIRATAAIAPAQWSWLEADLAAAANSKHVFILEHHPLYQGSEWKRLRAMLDPAKTTIFSGHWHRLSYDTEDGVPYYVLGPTATKSAQDRQAGRFLSFAHVVVSDGEPTISIIPVGEVLRHDFIDRSLTDLVDELARATVLTATTRAGGTVTLKLANPTDVEGQYTLTWVASPGWFADGVPPSEQLTLATGQSTKRDYEIKPSERGTTGPVLTIDYKIYRDEKTAETTRKFTLPVIVTLDAHRLDDVTIDGKLDEWTALAGHFSGISDRITYKPQGWSGPEDCSMVTRVAYDDKAIYLAVDVTDDVLISDAAQIWHKDGLEIFWDPRPQGERSAAFQGICRQVVIPISAGPSEPMDIFTNPDDTVLRSALQWTVLPRESGYVLELAIPLSAVAEGFVALPGKTLYLEVVANDKDAPGPKALTSCVVLSDTHEASRRTNGYARVTFR